MKKLVTKSLGAYFNTLAWVAPKKAGKFGFELFCRPFRGKITAQHLAFLHSAERFTIAHRNEKIQVYKWGHGPEKVLFVHGWQSHTYRWKKFIEGFDVTKHTLYSMDAPGHGLSTGNFLTLPLYGEVLEKVLEQIGRVNTVISHSIGSFTSIYTFHKNPQLSPEKLVALASPGEVKEFFLFYAQQLSLSSRTIHLMRSHFEKTVGFPPEYYSASAFALTLHCQGLLIHDEDDDETSVKNSIAIHQAWKNSSLMITKGFGHNLRSQDVVDRVIDFAKGNDSDVKVGQTQQQMLSHQEAT